MLGNVSNLQMLAQWSHLRKLCLCVLDLVLKLLQVHRNLDDILMLHHVPHNAPGQTKRISEHSWQDTETRAETGTQMHEYVAEIH